jgi:threonine dehydrogenase-like Zn-dependent dehydrogenase
MLALVLKKNKNLKLITIKQKKLFKKQYKIKINSIGICASDIPRAFENRAYHYPLIMGHEFSGTIVECGNGSKKFKKNDIVSCYPLIPKCNKCNSCKYQNYHLCEHYSYYGSRENGAMAEFLNVNEWNIFKLNKKLPITLGCLMEPIAVAFNIFSNIKSKKKSVLILGGGFIGLILSGIFNYYKFSNIDILDRNKYRLLRVPNKNYKKIIGDADTLNVKKNYDFIIDLIGNQKSLDICLEKSIKGGNVLLAGNIYKKITLSAKSLNLILRKELRIKGIWNSKFKSAKNNWIQAQNFIIKNQKWIFSLISHNVSLKNAKSVFNKIYLSKKKNYTEFKYIKCIISNEKK